MKRMLFILVGLLSLGYSYPDGTRTIKTEGATYSNARFEMNEDGLGITDRRGFHKIDPLSLSQEDLDIFLPMSLDVKGKHLSLVQINRVSYAAIQITDVASHRSQTRIIASEDVPRWLRLKLGIYSDPINKIK